MREWIIRWWFAAGAAVYAASEFLLHLFNIPHWH